MRLEARGYFVSEGDGGPNQTAIRTFLRGSSFANENTFVPNDDPRVVIESHTYIYAVGACEAPPVPTPERACEPLDLDSWQWTDDEHGGEELSALDAEPPAVTCSEPDAERDAKARRILAMTDEELATWIAGTRRRASRQRS
jgi:hypothetical protein